MVRNFLNPLQRVLGSYHGPFLDGHDSDWILHERERLYSFYVRGLTLLMHAFAVEKRYNYR